MLVISRGVYKFNMKQFLLVNSQVRKKKIVDYSILI